MKAFFTNQPIQFYIVSILLLLSLPIQAQYVHVIKFENIHTGKVQKIKKGNFLKIYAKGSNKKTYKISGRYNSIDGDLMILNGNKAVSLDEIQKIKHMPNGRRIGIIISIILFSLILYAAICFIALLSAFGESKGLEILTFILFILYPLGIIGFRRWTYSLGYDIMYNFQTDWKMILDAIP